MTRSHLLFYAYIISNFLYHVVRNVFVTYDVWLSIDAFKLIEFKIKIDQLDDHQDQETAFDRLREEMLSLDISIIEHNDLLGGANFNDEYHISRFQFKKNKRGIRMHQEIGSKTRWPLLSAMLWTYIRDRPTGSQAADT